MKNEVDFRKKYRVIDAIAKGSQSTIFLCRDTEKYNVCVLKLFKVDKREFAFREYNISKLLIEKNRSGSEANITNRNNHLENNATVEYNNGSDNNSQVENDASTSLSGNPPKQEEVIFMANEESEENLFGIYFEDQNLYNIRGKIGFLQKAADMDLHTYITKRGLNKSQRYSVMKQLVKSLKRVHNCNILHRDIKLENIIVTVEENEKLNVTLIDYGLSGSLEYDSEVELRRCCGSSRYQAPEVHPRNHEKYSPAIHTKGIDIFSLGVVFYALHYVSYPFGQVRHRNTMINRYTDHILTEKGVADSKSLGFSEEILTLIRDMLKLAPELRPSIEEVENRLEKEIIN